MDDNTMTTHASSRSVREAVRSPRQYPQQIMAADRHPPPAPLREERSVYLGSDALPVDRFTDRAFHEREVARLWPTTWQVACHESELSAVGDTVVYDIVDRSFLVVRSAPDTIKAFNNSCLHRCARLRSEDGPVTEIRCPFHGWGYDMDGALVDLPESWDFPQVDRARARLPEARVETWGGWVFVNMSDDAPPLDEYLGPLAQQFDRLRPFRRYVNNHVVVRGIECNWKVLQDAFLEVYHCDQTHPQMMIATDCYDAECSVYPEAAYMRSRMIIPIAVPGTGGHHEATEQDIVDHLFKDRVAGAAVPRLEPGELARPVAAEMVRKLKEETFHVDLSEASDAEIIDAIEYFVFPNFMPWAGYQNGIAYRFRPDGDDHLRSIMDVWLLNPVDDAAPDDVPHAPAPVIVPAADGVMGVPELGRFQLVLQQDLDNMSRVQRGMAASRRRAITLGNYQEVRIRDFHQTLDRYLDGGRPA